LAEGEATGRVDQRFLVPVLTVGMARIERGVKWEVLKILPHDVRLRINDERTVTVPRHIVEASLLAPSPPEVN
jgi:hypothetical protein